MISTEASRLKGKQQPVSENQRFRVLTCSKSETKYDFGLLDLSRIHGRNPGRNRAAAMQGGNGIQMQNACGSHNLLAKKTSSCLLICTHLSAESIPDESNNEEPHVSL